MQRLIAVVLLLAIAAMLCACGSSEQGQQSMTCKHSWNEATCVKPATCKNCGITDGTAQEHSYDAATCFVPQTCKKCGDTAGEKLKHKYYNLVCILCGSKDLNYAVVQRILRDCMSYMNDIENAKVSIEKNIALAEQYGAVAYYTNILDRTTEIMDTLEEVYLLCEKYPELQQLSNGLSYAINVEISDSNAYAYTIELGKHEVSTVDGIRITYLSLCDTYGVEVTVNDVNEIIDKTDNS